MKVEITPEMIITKAWLMKRQIRFSDIKECCYLGEYNDPIFYTGLILKSKPILLYISDQSRQNISITKKVVKFFISDFSHKDQEEIKACMAPYSGMSVTKPD